jgi:hypothetical protein
VIAHRGRIAGATLAIGMAAAACGSASSVPPAVPAPTVGTATAPTTTGTAAKVGCPTRSTGAFSFTTQAGAGVEYPDAATVGSAADRWLASGRPGYAVILRHDGGFVQAATDGRRFNLEWRECAPTTFTHYVAGRLDGDMSHATTIVADGPGPVTVAVGEVLDAEETRTLFDAFTGTGRRPSGWRWRDVTGLFAHP